MRRRHRPIADDLTRSSTTVLYGVPNGPSVAAMRQSFLFRALLLGCTQAGAETLLPNTGSQPHARLAVRAVEELSVDTPRHGWVQSPNSRGTLDILQLCLATIFICTFTLLCLNIPAPTDSHWALFRRRIKWMVLAIIGPEIVLTYSAGQWSRARHSVAAFRELQHDEWTMRMAFFADMGGFVLYPRQQTAERQDTGEKPGAGPVLRPQDAFPLNAKQLHWLVARKLVKYPELRPDDVWDRSKKDRLSKVITAFQIGYLIIECSGRAIQRLTITTLELNTLAIVVCSLMTAWFWLHKPSDLRTTVVLRCDSTIQELEQIGTKEWRTTPLDFVDENGPGWSINVQPFMKMPVIPEHRPIQRIPNDRFPMNPYGAQEYFVCVATLLFAGIHVAGWNFSFPTQLEQILWRAASLVLFVVTAAFWLLETMASWVRLGRWQRLYLRVTDPKKLAEFERARAERVQTMNRRRESTQLPLPWEFWSIMPVAVLYGIARLYLLIEAFLELRSVEQTAFATVNWSAYFPHI